MKKVTFQQIVVLFAIVGTLVVNGLASSLPLNGVTPEEISDQFEVFFVPAGYVFSIWGVIYLGLIAYGIYQASPANTSSETLQGIAPIFIVSSLANIGWLFMWHYGQFIFSILVMVLLLVSLILIYERLWPKRAQAGKAEFWSVHMTFSIYLGWITVATIANATTVLDFIGWSGWGISDALWAVIMLIIASLVGVAVVFRRQDPAYGLVLVWAFVGIANKHTGATPVDLTAWITAGGVFLAVLAHFIRRRLTPAT